MSSGELRIPFGLKDGAFYRAHEVENGRACGCNCPACKHPLIAANNGTKVIPHFRHATDSDCMEGFFKSVLLAAKDTVLQAGHLTLPGFEETVKDYAFSKIYQKQVSIPYYEVQAEKVDTDISEHHLHADVALWVKGHRLLVIFEISGRATSSKTRELRQAKQPSIAIDLSDLDIKVINDSQQFLFEVLSSPANRRWIYSPRGEHAVKQARLELETEEQQDRAASVATENERMRLLAEARQHAAEAKPVETIGPTSRLVMGQGPLLNPKVIIDNPARRTLVAERALAISASYKLVFNGPGGKGQECGRCYMASPSDAEQCLYCGSADQLSPLLITADLAKTIIHRLRSSTRPDKSVDAVPRLIAVSDGIDG